MIKLVLGLILFFGMHLVPSVTGVRDRLIALIGQKGYMALFALVSLLGVVLIVYGFAASEVVPVYAPLAWGRDAVFVVMAVAFMLFAAGDMKSNVKRITRHPMLWGVVLWSSVHLTVNGNLAEILLFGSFLLFSLIAMFTANQRGAALQQEKFSHKKDIMVVVGGVVVYAIFAKWLHPLLIGVAVI